VSITGSSRSTARIAIVTPDIVGPVKNGRIGTACFRYARTLANAGYKVEVLFSGGVEARSRRYWAAWYAKLGITFITLDDLIPNFLPLYGCRWHTERSLRIFEFLREREYNYIVFQDWHANGFWSARARRMGAAFERTPIGVISHSPNEWQKAGMRSFGHHPLDENSLEWAESQAIAAADFLISPSRHMVNWLREHDYELPARVAICPYTFEDPLVAGRPETVDRGHLVFFGRLETRKGLHLLGHALRALKHSGGPLPRKISCLGKLAEVEGVPTEAYLRELNAELPEVQFAIETNFDYRQAVTYIHDCNGVVVIPSILDNYPLTVLESITNGFCFIASDAGGIPEMIDPAAMFPATVEGLRGKLAELPRMDFGSLSHPYDPAAAGHLACACRCRRRGGAHGAAHAGAVRVSAASIGLRAVLPPRQVPGTHDRQLPEYGFAEPAVRGGGRRHADGGAAVVRSPPARTGAVRPCVPYAGKCRTGGGAQSCGRLGAA
jgi:glycosyltransferase involved in cell wall biosynthesis